MLVWSFSLLHVNFMSIIFLFVQYSNKGRHIIVRTKITTNTLQVLYIIYCAHTTDSTTTFPPWLHACSLPIITLSWHISEKHLPLLWQFFGSSHPTEHTQQQQPSSSSKVEMMINFWTLHYLKKKCLSFPHDSLIIEIFFSSRWSIHYLACWPYLCN